MFSLGLVGVNTSHADADTPAVIADARITNIMRRDDEERTRNLASAHDIETIVADPTEMIDAVDGALIVDDTGGGTVHAELARPFIETGIPIFIDKPMTKAYAGAVALFDLADEYKTPLMSCSALRFPVELDRERIDACGGLSSILSVGRRNGSTTGFTLLSSLAR